MRRIVCRIAVAAFLLSGSVVRAQQPAGTVASFPESPPGRLARALIDAINSGDSTRIRRWADTSFLPEIHRTDAAAIFDLYRRIQVMSGGLDVVRVAGSPWVMIDARVRRTGRLARLGLGIDPGTLENPRISGWHSYALADVAADGAWPTAPLSDSAIRATIADHVGRSAKRDEFSGVVRVMKGDSVLFEQAYGFAQRGLQAPNRTTTRFHIGSQGKMFTAVAIAQLVEAGKLRLNDTLASVLPEYPNADVARRITIEHLLTHTSGLGFGPGDERSKDPRWRERSVMEGLSAYKDEKLSFEPGTRWQYSNAGFGILAAVIERRSGMSFDDYLRRHVWGPAGMMRTDHGILDDRDDDRAVGYGWFDDDPIGAFERRPNWARAGRRSGGAGGQYSTVEDLARFAKAVREGRLVSPAMVERMTTTQGIRGESYGYGFFTYAFRGPSDVSRPSAGHGGGGASSGIDGGVYWFKDGRWTVAVLGNYDAPAAQNVIFRLMRFLARQ